MAINKTEKVIEEIRKNLEENKLVLGKNSVFKKLKQGKLSKLFLSSNCQDEVRKDADYYAKLAKVKVVELQYPNEELGTICKKPFAVSVLGLLK